MKKGFRFVCMLMIAATMTGMWSCKVNVSRIHTVNGWIPLFDGKTLDGWKVGENAETFSVQDGAIVAHGNTAHLFYDGQIALHNFTNFEFKAEVMTEPGSNSGIYFHTEY